MAGVVALNPWVYPTDGADLRGRRVLLVHGTDDRVASPRSTSSLAERLSATTTVRAVMIEGGRHAMLRPGKEFEPAAAEFVLEVAGSV